MSNRLRIPVEHDLYELPPLVNRKGRRARRDDPTAILPFSSILGSRFSRTGQAVFTTVGTQSWTVPAGVYSICIVLVAGGNRGGGGLSWFNDIPVRPGQIIQVQVGAQQDIGTTGNTIITIGSHTYQANSPATAQEAGIGGGINSSGAPFRSKGGGNGGVGVRGGGGAGGYSGNGGSGNTTTNNSARAGTGGAGGGGGRWGTSSGHGGGGVGLLGEGPSGAGGVGVDDTSSNAATRGGGGSGGEGGGSVATGGLFGGGVSANVTGNVAGTGAARFIYGLNRAFPATRTGDL